MSNKKEITNKAINNFLTSKSGKKDKKMIIQKAEEVPIEKPQTTKVSSSKPKRSKSKASKSKAAPKASKTTQTTDFPKRKPGRPNTLKPNTKYVRLGGAITEETMFKMKSALFGKFRGRFQSQQEFIEEAINHYIDTQK